MKFKILKTFYYDGNTKGIFHKCLEEDTGIERILANNRKFNILVGKNSFSLKQAEVYNIISRDGDDIIAEPANLSLSENGYIQLNCSDGTTEWLHRIVVFSFGDRFGNHQDFYGKKSEIDHIDGNKQRNIPENLEIVDPGINKKRAWDHCYTGAKERFMKYLSDLSLEEFNDLCELIVEENKKNNKEKEAKAPWET